MKEGDNAEKRNSKVKFLHFGDTHLGKSGFKKEERKEDFFDNFKQVIDSAIEEDVDFVIHSGDLFDTANPSMETLIRTIYQLKRLKKKEIPVLITAGSHDIGVGETVISLLEEIGVLTNLSSEDYTKVEGDKIVLDGKKVGGAFVCGVAGRQRKIDKIYESLEPRKRGELNIFSFHHAISDVSGNFSDIPTSLLPKGFDYYAGGHWHSYYESDYSEGKIIYPGSTGYNDIKEMEKDDGKYFCIIKWDGKNLDIEKREINTRPIDTIEVDCGGKEASEVAELCIEEIPSKSEEGILILRLEGKLSGGTKSDINRSKVKSVGKERGYIHTKIYLSNLKNPKTPFVKTEKKTPSEIEREYLKKQDYSDEMISVAEQLIKQLGKDIGGSELETASKNSIEFIKENMIEGEKGGEE